MTLWDQRYLQGNRDYGTPSSALSFFEALLPRSGAALDLAGGHGRNAVPLVERGLELTLVDGSAVALEQARQRLPGLRTLHQDLEQQPPPPGPWKLILISHYLQRSLFPLFPGLLAPGGLLLYVHPTVRNLERHERPSLRFLLEEGELLRPAEGLEILHFSEEWRAENRHEAWLLARKSS